MTEKELSKLFYLNREIEVLQKQLCELRSKSEYKQINLTDPLTGKGTISDITGDTATKLADLEIIIGSKLQTIYSERRKIEIYINTLDDPEIRLIIRLRCVNGLTWESIAAEIMQERTTVSKKFRRFLKDSHNSR